MNSSLFILLVLMCVSVGCDKGGKKQNPLPRPPPTVVVQKISPRSIDVHPRYLAQAVASQQTDVAVQVSGMLLQQQYHEGQHVQEGQLLAQLDADVYHAAVMRAEARFVQAMQQWQRLVPLHEEGVISGKEYDQVKADYEAAEAEMWQAQINLDHTQIHAPLSGLIGKKFFSEGAILAPGGERSVLANIKQIDPIYLYFSYSDKEFLERQSNIAAGRMQQSIPLKAVAWVDPQQQESYEGVVDFIDHAVETSTGTIQARAVMPNPDGRILPGQWLPLSLRGLVLREAIVIPERAVMQGPQGPFVYCIEGDAQAVVRPIILGALTEKGVVVTQGLHKDDRIVVEGMIKVIPGQAVQIESYAKESDVADSVCPHCHMQQKN